MSPRARKTAAVVTSAVLVGGGGVAAAAAVQKAFEAPRPAPPAMSGAGG